jgi:hypothetical protein
MFVVNVLEVLLDQVTSQLWILPQRLGGRRIATAAILWVTDVVPLRKQVQDARPLWT